MDLLSDWTPPSTPASSSAAAAGLPTTVVTSNRENSDDVTATARSPSSLGGSEGEEAEKQQLLTINDMTKIQWKYIPGVHLPRKRVSFGFCPCRDNSVLLCGGMDIYYNVLSSVQIYHPTTKSFSTMPDMLTHRTACAAVSVQGNVYVVGGRDEHRRIQRTTEVYSSSLNTWQRGTTMPVGRAGCMVFSHQSHLIVVGGHDGKQLLESVHVMDTTVQQWSMGPALPFGRIGFCAVQVQNTIYVFGGRTSNGRATNVCHSWTIEEDMFGSSSNLSGEWAELPPLATPRYGCVALATKHYILVAGGYNSVGKPLLTTEVYCIDTKRWSNVLPNLRAPRIGCGGTNHGRNSFCLLGGLDGKDFSTTVEELKLAPQSRPQVVPTKDEGQIAAPRKARNDDGVEIQSLLLPSAPTPAPSTQSTDNNISSSFDLLDLGGNKPTIKHPPARGLPLDTELGVPVQQLPDGCMEMGKPVSPPANPPTFIPLNGPPPGAAVGVPVAPPPNVTPKSRVPVMDLLDMGDPQPQQEPPAPKHNNASPADLWASMNGVLTEEEALEIALRESIK